MGLLLYELKKKTSFLTTSSRSPEKWQGLFIFFNLVYFKG